MSLTTVLLGYLFRSCFASIVPRFEEIMTPLGLFVPKFPKSWGEQIPKLRDNLNLDNIALKKTLQSAMLICIYIYT